MTPTVIRAATPSDLNTLAQAEAMCFERGEAADKAVFRDRLLHYPNHFWLLFEGERLVAFVDGFVTDERDLTDEMFARASMHDETGAWQMIFGVATLPEFRHCGRAGILLKRAIDDARSQGRIGVVLTCKTALLGFYAKFGFKDEGITSKSSHGNVVWHQMRLLF